MVNFFEDVRQGKWQTMQQDWAKIAAEVKETSETIKHIQAVLYSSKSPEQIVAELKRYLKPAPQSTKAIGHGGI